jgi:hypothetical protein
MPLSKVEAAVIWEMRVKLPTLSKFLSFAMLQAMNVVSRLIQVSVRLLSPVSSVSRDFFGCRARSDASRNSRIDFALCYRAYV